MTKAINCNLKDFDKLNRVGKGTFGDLFLLKSKKSGEIYAGKFTVNSISGSLNTHNLEQEISIISQLNHPSIIKFIGFCTNAYENKPHPVIVTEYLPNGSLDQIINLAIHDHAPEKWDDTQKLITLYGIASGMALLHSHNILHRDLKPSNILLDGFLYPKINDFGLCYEKKSRIQSNIPKGTPLYMAPEIFDKCNYTKAGDVYAFAIIAYQIICDEKPITVSDNPKKVMMKVMDGKRYSFEYPINKSYRDLIKKCWDQDMEKRLTFEQIKEELKTDPGFITETVDEERFLKYVYFIDNQKISLNLDSSKDMLNSTMTKENNDKANEEPPPDDFPIKIYKKLDQMNKDLVNKAIRENDSDAQFHISINFLHRSNKFPKNSQMGIKFLKMAVENGNLAALKNYCRKVIDGDLVSEDLKEIKTKLTPLIDGKDPDIHLLFGLLCKKENNIDQAEKYFEKASKEGNAEAMYELGIIHLNQSNDKKAQEYFDMAKKNGFKKNPPHVDKSSNEKVQKSVQNTPKASSQLSSPKKNKKQNKLNLSTHKNDHLSNSLNKKKSIKHTKKVQKK